MTTTSLQRLAAAAVASLALAARAQVLAPVSGSPFEFPSGVNSNVVRLSPDGATLYVTNQNTNQVTALAVGADGALSLRGTYGPTSTRPVGIAVSPDGAHVYVSTSVGVDVLQVAADGSLSVIQTLSLGQPMNGIAFVRRPNGDFVYTLTNAASNEVIALFVHADGTLIVTGRTPTNGFGSSFGFLSRNRLAYAAGRLFVENEGTISVFDVWDDGRLAAVPGSPFLTNASATLQDVAYGLAVTPDGQTLFVGFYDSVERHAVGADGALTYVGTYGLGVGTGAPPNFLAVDPSGRYLVASENKANAYAVLEIASMQPVQGSPVSATGSAGLDFDASGTLLYGGHPNSVDTWVNAFGFVAGLPIQSSYYLTLEVQSDPSGTITSDVGGLSCPGLCSGAFAPGTVVSLTATPPAGWLFQGWRGACSGTGPCAVTMTAPQLVLASFYQAPNYGVIVSKAGAGTGTVTSTPDGISCGAACSAGFAAGTTVTLTTVADAGSAFTGWSGACTGTGACVLPLVDAGALVTATFEKTVTLTAGASGAGKGTITGAGLSCTSGSTTGCTVPVPITSPAQVVTLTATPDAASFFQYWSGCTSFSGLTCTVSMDRARTVYATFAPSTYLLTARPAGSGAGSISGPGVSCATGSTAGCSTSVPNTTPATEVTLVAAPDASSIFQGWTGCTSVSDLSCTVSMTGAKTVTAQFAPSTYPLTAKTGGTGKGTVTGAGMSCTSGSTAGCSASISNTIPATQVTLVASPDASSIFTGWSGCDAVSGESCTVTMSYAKQVTATFAPSTFLLTAATSGSGKGTVTGDGGIVCASGSTSGCTASFPNTSPATQVTLVATPDASSLFSGWTGCDVVSGTTCVVGITGARTATASFAPASFVLTASTSGTGKGTITAPGISCTTGSTAGCSITVPNTTPATSVTLEAAPDASSIFTGWSGCTTVSGTTCSISVTASRTVTASFSPAGFTLTARATGAGVGTITGPDISCATGATTGCTTIVANTTPATVVTLVASPDASSLFQSWSGCTSVSGTTCTVSMTAAKSVTASFAPATYLLTARTAGGGKGTITADAGISCSSGSTSGCTAAVPNTIPITRVTLVAAPDGSSIFTGWSGCDSVSGTSCTVAMSYARSVTATFQPSTYTLTVATGGAGRGTVSGSGISCTTGSTAGCTASVPNTSPATTVTLTATPDAYSNITIWSGCTTSSGNTCNVTMSGARTVTVSFGVAAYPLTAAFDGFGSGAVSGGGIDCHTGTGGVCAVPVPVTNPATQVTLTAVPDAGYTFASWSGCTSVSGATCTISVGGARTVRARFDIPAAAVYEASTSYCNGETYRLLLTDPALISEADADVATGRTVNVDGAVAIGDGGFNAPWSWSFSPSSVTFPTTVLLVLQPCPSELSANPAAWAGQHVYQPGRLLRRLQ